MITDALLSLQKQIWIAEQERIRITARATRCNVCYDSIHRRSRDHSDIVSDSVVALDQINRQLLELKTKQFIAVRFLKQAMRESNMSYTPVWDAMLFKYEDGLKTQQIMRKMDLSKQRCYELLRKGCAVVKHYEAHHKGQAEKAIDF